MSFGKLLAAGRSIGGSQDGSRYKIDPRVFLPKFVSPKNPFAQPPNKDASAKAVSPATHAQALPQQAADSDARATVPVRIAKTVARVLAWKRVAGLCIGFARKCNPVKFFKGWPWRAGSALPRFGKSPVQEEFPLERVRVVRNDLTDADIQLVSGEKRSGLKRGCDEGAWERLTTRVFGNETM